MSTWQRARRPDTSSHDHGAPRRRHPPVPSPSRPPSRGAVSPLVTILLPFAAFLARNGIDAEKAKDFIRSAARLARYVTLAALPALSDRRALMDEITAVMERRANKRETPLRELAGEAARAYVLAIRREEQASNDIPSLEAARNEVAADLKHATREVGRLVATLPQPPPPEPPTVEELEDEQSDADPVYAPRLTIRLFQRALEVAIDFAAFFPLVSSAGIGFELLGVEGSRAVVVAMALAASLAVPFGACRLGEMTVEGGLRDPRISFFSWAGFSLLLCVPVLIGGSRALQLAGGEYGTLAGGSGVFAVSVVMVGIVLLEFTQGRRAADAAIVAARRPVAARQRHERRNPPPAPEPPPLVAARQRQQDTQRELAEREANLEAAHAARKNASERRSTASLEFRDIHEVAKQAAHAEHGLACQAASRALAIRAVYVARFGSKHLAEEPPDRVLIEQLPMPPVFDPYPLIDEVAREQGW
jgi:hypothetical protein